MEFLNRKDELEILNKRFNTDSAQFLIIYGRRRVGKTLLLKRFAEDKPYIYFVGDMRPDPEQIKQFADILYQFKGDELMKGAEFRNWDPLFEYITRLSEEKVIVIFDEFPYLISSNKALPSIIQRFWDEHWSKTNIKLILCGSYISTMEEETLGYRSPLYGRRTGQLLIEPMDFFDASSFFPNKSMVERIETYIVCGGIPFYLTQFRGGSLFDRIGEVILQRDGVLYNEVPFLLLEELREPRNYFAILEAISFGKTRINEIAQTSGLAYNLIGRYLSTLQTLRIITRITPVTEDKPYKSKKGLYKLSDNYFRFYFRFVYPNKSYLEEGEEKYVLEKLIRPYFSSFAGPIFEQVCIQLLKKLNKSENLPFKFRKIGPFWKKDIEIDIVALGEREVLFGECKWWDKEVGINVLEDLTRKSYQVEEVKDKKPLYCLFSKSGFTSELKNKAGNYGVLLFDLEDFRDSGFSGHQKVRGR